MGVLLPLARQAATTNAWPVAGAEGLLGMISATDLDRALAEGMNRIAEILVESPGHSSPTADQLPHVHPDHSLSLALERMGASGLNVLPVVSRANVRQLLGIVVLDDILHTYGVTKRNNPESEAKSP